MICDLIIMLFFKYIYAHNFYVCSLDNLKFVRYRPNLKITYDYHVCKVEI